MMEKTIAGFIYCLKCGRKYESIMKTDDEWKCESCGNPFPTDKDGKIGQKSRKSEQVDAIRCDMCNELTSVIPENLLVDLIDML